MSPGNVARELSVIKTRSKSQQMSADVVRGHGGDGGGDDRPPSHQIPTGFLGQPRAPENPIWVAGERADSIPARRPGTSGQLPWGARSGVAVALPFLAPSAGGAEGEDHGSDW
ncbi:hypothetical protein Tco_0040123, partial [Tanacetum coccineum]